MKLYTLFFLGLLFLCSSYCFSIPTQPKGKSGYHISVEVDQLSSAQACLGHYHFDKQYIDDTVDVANGHFEFKGEEKLEQGIYLVFFPPDNNYFELLVGEDQHFELHTVDGAFLENMTVKGSKECSAYYKDIRYMTSQRNKVDSLTKLQPTLTDEELKNNALQQVKRINEEVRAYREKFLEDNSDYLYTKIIQASRDPEVPEPPRDEAGRLLDSAFAFNYYKAHYFDSFDFQDPRLLRTPVLHYKVKTYMERLSYRHIPDSMTASIDFLLNNLEENKEVFRTLTAHFLNQFSKPKYQRGEEIFCHIVYNYYESGRADWIADSTLNGWKERCEKITPTRIGKVAPDFSVKDTSDQFQRLHQIEADWTVIYFWSYDCSHCKKVTPKLVELFKKYELAQKGVKVLTININGDVGEWKEKIQTYGLDMEGAINCEDIYRRSRSTEVYDIYSTPRLFLLDKDKKIKNKQIGPEQLLLILSHEIGFKLDEEDKFVPEPDEKEK